MEKLKRYIDVPEVTVIVRESRSMRIYIIGKVNRPGPYDLGTEMTILQALSTAGGFAEWADTKNILIRMTLSMFISLSAATVTKTMTHSTKDKAIYQSFCLLTQPV